jgi:4-hydroxybutyrate dehydrogenase/sulfolactaldehyde 3-reductase
MASNLCRKGFRLSVYDVVPAAVAALEELQAHGAGNVAEATRGADVIVTMLPNSQIVREVIAGPDGVFAHAKPGAVVMDMSTIDPTTTDGLATQAQARGLSLVDAPVGRLASHADAGQSLFMVGASDADFARVKPLLEAMARRSIIAARRARARAPS